MIDIVSETYRISWTEAQDLPVTAFLNVYSYAVARKSFEKEMVKREHEKMKARYRARPSRRR